MWRKKDLGSESLKTIVMVEFVVIIIIQIAAFIIINYL